jgi:hypothetical protein
VNRELAKRLELLTAAVIAEARRNEDFAQALDAALELRARSESSEMGNEPRRTDPTAGRRNRRPGGLVDPIALIAQGEPSLRASLEALDVEQLKDVIAEHGMDTRKLAMKWKDRTRLADLIVTFARERLAKGSVFRSGDPSTR